MFIYLLFLVINANAEYRAFEHEIVNIETNSKRSIASTLDPDQYPGYYPVEKNEVVVMKNTWICYGDTSKAEKICPNPRLEKTEDLPLNANP